MTLALCIFLLIFITVCIIFSKEIFFFIKIAPEVAIPTSKLLYYCLPYIYLQAFN